MSVLGASAIARFGRRARVAARGVRLVYQGSGNARIEATLADLALSAALAEGGAWRIGLVVMACGSVLAMEAMNSAVEYTVDRIGPGRHPLAAAAKDSAAGAVLVAALAAAALALVVLVPDLGACWQAFRRASPIAAGAWVLLLALLGAGTLWPERAPAQGGGAGRRTGSGGGRP